MFNAEMPLNRADTFQRMINFFAVARVVFYRRIRFPNGWGETLLRNPITDIAARDAEIVSRHGPSSMQCF
jgi:hypothetical protein